MLSWVRERERKRENRAPCKVPFSNWIHACALASPRGAPGEQTGRTHRCYGTTGRTLVKRLVAARPPSPAVKVALATDDNIQIPRTILLIVTIRDFVSFFSAEKKSNSTITWQINNIRRRIIEYIKIVIKIVNFFDLIFLYF